MFRPVRMTSVSVICVKKDTEKALEALNSFGEFHIEESTEKISNEEYAQNTQNVEESLTNVSDLIRQLTFKKSDLLGIFRETQTRKIQVTVENWRNLSETTRQEILNLKKETDTLTSRLTALQEKTANLNHIKDMLTIMNNMGADLAAMEELKLIHVAIASVPHKNMSLLSRALSKSPIILHRCYLRAKFDFVCLAMPSKIQNDVEKILKTVQGEIFHIPPELPHNITLALKDVNHQLTKDRKAEKETLKALEKLGKENKDKLASLKETVENILALLRAERKIVQSERFATIKGFVPTKKLQEFTEYTQSILSEKVLVINNEVMPTEDPPTLLRHNRFIRPFEEITKLYGSPHYDEIDPTSIIAVTFPLIFGLMFADVGHGSLLLGGGLTLGKLIKKNQAMKNLCYILAACGLGAIFAGLLFGEFFGVRIFAPLWFDPFSNVLTFLIFSLIIGIIQITSGLVLEMVNFALKRDLPDVVFTSIPKIAFYLGSVYLIVVYQLNFAAWFNGPILFALVPFVILVVGKPILSAISSFPWRSLQTQRTSGSVVERLFESGDLVTRLLSNTISYSRILALLMAHWALMLTVFVVAGLVASSTVGLILSGIIIVGGNLFVISLEGLIVFIHSLRLFFYEWFSKFYQGTGTEFAPFKQKFLYTKIVFQETEQS